MQDTVDDVFSQSFERCSKDPDFMDRFYNIFLGCSDEIKEKFHDTNMKKQKDLLLVSLSYMMMAARNPSILENLAVQHNKHNRNIPPAHYSHWLESVVSAVQLTDPGFSLDVASAWRKTLEPGINYMIAQYDV